MWGYCCHWSLHDATRCGESKPLDFSFERTNNVFSLRGGKGEKLAEAARRCPIRNVCSASFAGHPRHGISSVPPCSERYGVGAARTAHPHQQTQWPPSLVGYAAHHQWRVLHLADRLCLAVSAPRVRRLANGLLLLSAKA